MKRRNTSILWVGAAMLIGSVAKLIFRVGGHYGTALCAACANEEFEVAEFLVKEGAKAALTGKLADVGEMAADVGIGQRFGSPLHVATLVGNTKIITLLLDHLEDENANNTCELAVSGGMDILTR
jgi:ankyrin repeat protein